VNDVLRSGCRENYALEQIFDETLDVCSHGSVLMLQWQALSRTWAFAPVAASCYTRFRREMRDSSSSERIGSCDLRREAVVGACA
jgi:hypothetical protein